MTDEKWYREGSPVIEALAKRLWEYKTIPGKLPWSELGVQSRVGPRCQAYEILAIVEKYRVKELLAEGEDDDE